MTSILKIKDRDERKGFHLFFLILFLLWGGAQTVSFAGSTLPQEFFQALEDLPLMPGLYETPDGSIVFDKPGGRIVDLQAFSETLSAQAIWEFYEQVLQQTGWTRKAQGLFFRQAENLTMEIEEENGGVAVRFRIFPQEKERD